MCTLHLLGSRPVLRPKLTRAKRRSRTRLHKLNELIIPATDPQFIRCGCRNLNEPSEQWPTHKTEAFFTQYAKAKFPDRSPDTLDMCGLLVIFVDILLCGVKDFSRYCQLHAPVHGLIGAHHRGTTSAGSSVNAQRTPSLITDKAVLSVVLRKIGDKFPAPSAFYL